MKIVLFIGAPGSGKGTQCGFLMDLMHAHHVSVGDLLRKEIQQGSEIGRIAKALIDDGNFVPDQVSTQIALKAVEQARDASGDKETLVLLDGYPRNLEQARLLDKALGDDNLAVDGVVHLIVSDEVAAKRVSDRLVHVPSGRVYNNTFKKPRVEGRDDVTGEPLERRPDDSEHERVQKRLEKYHAVTEPVVGHYADKGTPLLEVLDHESVQGIHEHVLSFLSSLKQD